LNFFQGLGLATPQVGIHLRVLTIDLNDEKTKIAMINPEILWQSEETQEVEESCFSVPLGKAIVERPSKIVVKFKNIDWKDEELTAEGLLAQVIAHEIDHLEGILFIDKLSRLKREMIVKKLMKRKVKFNFRH